MKKLVKLLATVMNKCAHFFGLARDTSNGSGKRKRSPSVKGSPYPESTTSSSEKSTPRPGFVRIVHRGGREELYPSEISAVQLMEKYPGMSVTKPEIFKTPHESILGPQEKLLLGHKYLIIPSTAVRKLQQKRPEKFDEWDSVVMDLKEMDFDESVFSAKEFYAPKGKSPKGVSVKGIRRKKPFVPPLPKARLYRGPGWEPSLTSIQELSP